MKNIFVRANLLKSLIFVFLLFLLAGCSQPEVQPLRFNDAPWQANEVSTYQLTDINDNFAGTARYDLTRSEENRWNLRREINAQGTQEIIAVDMTREEFRPIESTLIRITRDGTEVVSAKYSSGQVNMELTTKLNVQTVQRMSIPSDARDQATMVMLLRALPLAQDYAVYVNVFLPIVGILDRVTVEVQDQVQVTTAAGTYDTWYVRMATADSETEAWVATQAPYPVVKFVDSRNGGIFELSEYLPGQ